jgi:sulfate permease, SulP family
MAAEDRTSNLALVIRASRDVATTKTPDDEACDAEPGTQVYRDVLDHPDDEAISGVVVPRLDGGLFFATSDALEDRIREVSLASPALTGIVLDSEGIDFVDSQGAAKMRELLELTSQAGVTLHLARVKPAVSSRLARDGFFGLLGDGRVHGNVHRSVEAHLGEAPSPPS